MDLIRTVGLGTLSAAQLGDLLAGSGVEAVVDVRRHPGSRSHPHFNRGELARWLPERGIGYRWDERLGGRRRGSADSVNTGLGILRFRAYADHMASDAFRAALEELLGAASARSVALMCSESLWLRCHRRLLADHLVLVDGVAVEHLFHTGRSCPHAVTADACRQGDRVVYEPMNPTLPEGW